MFKTCMYLIFEQRGGEGRKKPSIHCSHHSHHHHYYFCNVIVTSCISCIISYITPTDIHPHCIFIDQLTIFENIFCTAKRMILFLFLWPIFVDNNKRIKCNLNSSNEKSIYHIKRYPHIHDCYCTFSIFNKIMWSC